MTDQPDVGGGVEFRDVRVEFSSRGVVFVLLPKGVDDASVVAGKRRGGAVADFMP
jgi:hypothetical protein